MNVLKKISSKKQIAGNLQEKIFFLTYSDQTYKGDNSIITQILSIAGVLHFFYFKKNYED